MASAAFRFGCAVLAAAGFLLGRTAIAVEPAKPDDAPRIARLIEDLDSDTFATRDEASAELLRLGESALPAVKKALEQTHSPEVRSRAERLIREITIWGGPRHEIRLPAILDQVKLACRAAEPATACQDGKLEKLLLQAVRPLAATAGRKDYNLPVAFQDVRFAPFDPQNRFGNNCEKALVVLKRGNITFARHSIILADEQVEINNADDCIIIARLAVRVRISSNCIIIAGMSLDTDIDRGSILLSGSRVDLGIVTGAICAATAPSRFGIVQNTTLVNWPQTAEVDRGGRRENRIVQLPELVLADSAAKNPLAPRIQLTDTFADRGGIALFRLANGKGEYVARYDRPINDPDGKPISELRGWTLCFAGRAFAVFTDGNDFASLSCSDP